MVKESNKSSDERKHAVTFYLSTEQKAKYNALKMEFKAKHGKESILLLCNDMIDEYYKRHEPETILKSLKVQK